MLWERNKNYILLRNLRLYFIVLLYLYPIVILFQGEEYKLFWPEQSEFIRMAARFGAKIIPFGAVGEDDVFQVICRLYLSDFFNYLILAYIYTKHILSE